VLTLMMCWISERGLGQLKSMVATDSKNSTWSSALITLPSHTQQTSPIQSELDYRRHIKS
jgi:hypothetical protein